MCEPAYSLWWIIHAVCLQPVLPHSNITQWREFWQLKTAGWWSNVDPKRLQSPLSLGAKTPSCSPTQPGENSLNETANVNYQSCPLICHYCVQKSCFIIWFNGRIYWPFFFGRGDTSGEDLQTGTWFWIWSWSPQDTVQWIWGAENSLLLLFVCLSAADFKLISVDRQDV